MRPVRRWRAHAQAPTSYLAGLSACARFDSLFAAFQLLRPILALLSLVALAAEGYAALTGRPALLNRQKMAEIRQRYWVADVGKSKERLGFTASHDFRDGARLTAEWYRAAGWI